MRVVYVDVLFALNFLMDYLLLVLTARLGGVYRPRWRLALAAAAGGLAAVALYFPPLPLPLGLLCRGAVCAGLTALAFGRQPGRFLRLCGLLCGVTFALAGGVSALAFLGRGLQVHNGVVYFELPLRLLLCCAGAVWLLLGVSGGTALRLDKRTARLSVTLGERTVVLRALRDSGNLLRDPLTGKQVALVGAGAAAGLLPPEHRALLRALDGGNAPAVCAELTGRGAGLFRLMPYQTAAGSALLLLIRPDRLEIDGAAEDGYLLGLSPAELEAGGECRAVIGG